MSNKTRSILKAIAVILVLLAVLIPKVGVEVFLHALQKRPWDLLALPMPEAPRPSKKMDVRAHSSILADDGRHLAAFSASYAAIPSNSTRTRRNCSGISAEAHRMEGRVFFWIRTFTVGVATRVVPARSIWNIRYRFSASAWRP